ncbi:ABC transporter substrate-binding protein [Leptolyngbya sp. BL0902]|uniref:extracellular solute-binding protein n=1 Tax=Leptolyngbya sp. BL0902 TaxID=1115757 RepID=UPI0018E820BA|nr:extracellular solute-binding protein [Leptolyngbya sp. BL0902]QQE66238.1 ABC transporter substrate-binding protein [Leptolyngbya sp. BL0902]
MPDPWDRFGAFPRRHLLKLALASGLLPSLATSCHPPALPPVVDEPEEDSTQPNGEMGRQFAGTALHLLLNDHPWTTGLRPHLGEFEAITGMTLNLEVVPESDYFTEMEAALHREGSDVDVFFLPMDSTAYRLWQRDCLQPLTPFIHDPTLTARDYNLYDFPEGFRQTAMFPPGDEGAALFGIPATVEVYILFYNQRLVNRFLDGRVPQTMVELVQAASQINASGEAVGMVLRGVPADTIIDTVTGVVLNEWGNDPTPLPFNLWFDGDWSRPRMTDPRIVAGLTTYANLMRAGPPTIKQMDWAEATDLFRAGKAAFYIDASLFGPSFEDPVTSAIAGDVGYAGLPLGQGQSLTGHWLWGLGIPKTSPQPSAAWLFIQWATSAAMEAKIAVATGGAPRFSSWLTPSVYTEAMDLNYALTVQTAMRTSRPTVVLHPQWNRVAMAITNAIHRIYDGEDPRIAADQLQATALQYLAQATEVR